MQLKSVNYIPVDNTVNSTDIKFLAKKKKEYRIRTAKRNTGKKSDSPAEALDSHRRRVSRETKTIENTRSVRATASSRGFFSCVIRHNVVCTRVKQSIRQRFERARSTRDRLVSRYDQIGSLTCLS